MIVSSFLLSLAIGFAGAIGFIPAPRAAPRKRACAFLGSCIPILCAPLVVSDEVRFVRFLAAAGSAIIWMKLYDLHRDTPSTSRLSWRPLLVFFLPNWGLIVRRKLDAVPRPSRCENWRWLASGVIGLGVSAAVVTWLFRLDWSGQPFGVEHSAKTVSVFVALAPVGWTAMSIWRLAGGKAIDFLNAPLLACTPADFWRRYNQPVQQFFFENIFKRVGGFRSPARATLITFAISGLIHEYVFGIASGRVRGYQMIFFLLHGCAAAATLRARPRGWHVVPCIGGTFAFNLASSVLFFANLNDVAPFYSRELPEWLSFW